MTRIAQFGASYMAAHPGEFTVTGLFGHYYVKANPGMAADYGFWGPFCYALLCRCGKMLVLQFPGWELSSGVAGEIELASKLNIPIQYITIE